MGHYPSDWHSRRGHYPKCMDEQGKERIRALLKKHEMTMKAASLKAGLGETFVRDVLERNRDPIVAKLAALAKVLGSSVSELLGEEGTTGTVPVAGIAGANPDGSIAYMDAGELGDAPMPPNGTARTVAVEVRGDSMRGIAENGWWVYYDDRRDPPTDDLLGRICVVGLADGRTLIKRLIRGRKRKHFDLESYAAPTLYDARVVWAAPVTAIIPSENVSLVRARGVA